MKLWDILRSWNLLYRKQVLKTTWKLRVFLLFLLIVFVLATGRFWLLLMSESLVHEDQMAPSDVILVESWENPFLAGLSHAATLQHDGYAGHAIVIRLIPRNNELISSDATERIWQLYCMSAGLRNPEVVAVNQVEPITLNMARQIGKLLMGSPIRSVTLISPLFHSKRSLLSYREILEPLGISVRCTPISGAIDRYYWWKTNHDMLMVIEEFLKLQYYRIFLF